MDRGTACGMRPARRDQSAGKRAAGQVGGNRRASSGTASGRCARPGFAIHIAVVRHRNFSSGRGCSRCGNQVAQRGAHKQRHRAPSWLLAARAVDRRLWVPRLTTTATATTATATATSPRPRAARHTNVGRPRARSSSSYERQAYPLEPGSAACAAHRGHHPRRVFRVPSCTAFTGVARTNVSENAIIILQNTAVFM
jgi:hypothetical protein